MRRSQLAAVSFVALVAAVFAWWLLGSGRRPPAQATGRPEYAPVTGPLEFPERVRRAPLEVRELYEFAARRPDVLRYMPCFCGCWKAGHRSNYDCFIDEVHSDGTVEIDGMGFT